MNDRILELAIQALEKKRSDIQMEIAEITAQLGGTEAETVIASDTAVVSKPDGRGTRTAAQRRAMSERMKAAWAARKAKAAKPAKTAKPKAGSMSAANKARSAKMKASWAARKARKGKK